MILDIVLITVAVLSFVGIVLYAAWEDFALGRMIWGWTIKNPKSMSELRFKWVFGFWPGEAREPILKEHYQGVVHRVLLRRADTFLLRCKEEEAPKQEAKENLLDNILKNLRRLSSQLKRAKLGVKRSKRRFWSAHKLARDFDFPVLRRAKDYAVEEWGDLTEPLQEEGKI